MAASLAVGVALVGPVAAQEPPEPQPLEGLDNLALFASPASDGVPNTLTRSFPPQVVCVVVPQTCTEQSEPIRDPITGIIQEADESAEPEPAHAVSPDTMALTYEAGNIRYQNGLTFELPAVPSGERVDSFVLQFNQINPTYSSSSPAFRQVVLAAVAGAGSQNPAVFQEQFVEALNRDPVDQPEMGIEVCPFKSPYPIVPNPERDEDTPRGEYENEPAEPNSANPPLAASDEAIPEQDSDGDGLSEPNIDCLFGSLGVLDPDTSVWSFDLTFALRAWDEGTLENNGVFFRPTGAPNLAFGDPDTSFNAQVTLELADATYTLASSEPPPPPAPLAPAPPPPPAAQPAPPPAQSQPQTQTTTTFTPAPITSSGGGFSSGSAPVVTNDPGPVAAAPAPAPPPAQETVAQQPIAAPDIPEPGAYWLLWLLVPVFLAGMYLTSSSLTDEELVMEGNGRNGAMTRLIANQEAQLGRPITV